MTSSFHVGSTRTKRKVSPEVVGVPPSLKRILAEMDESEHGERDMISKTMVPVLEAVKVARRHPLFKNDGDW